MCLYIISSLTLHTIYRVVIERTSPRPSNSNHMPLLLLVTGHGVIELFHGYTYSGHPLAMAAGLATLDVYKEEGKEEEEGRQACVRSVCVCIWLQQRLISFYVFF